MSSQAPRQIKPTIAANIKAARVASDLTQSQLASAMEMEAMNVSRWERGVVTPGLDSLARLASVVGRDIGWFYTDHDREEAA